MIGSARWTAIGTLLLVWCLPVGAGEPLLINQIVVSPHDPNILYAAGRPVGVLKSTDRGLTWAPVRGGLLNTSVYHLAADPTDSETVYVGTFGGGVFVTRDGGRRWTAINSGLGNTNIHALALDPTDARRLIVSTSTGAVFETRDRGANWRFYGQRIPLQEGNVIASLLFRFGLAYLGQDTLFQRGPRDSAWRSLGDGLRPAVITTLAIDHAGRFYAGTRTHGLFRSTDRGRRWTGVGFDRGWVRQVVPGPAGSSRLIASVLGRGLFRSEDDGASWQRLEAGLPANDLHIEALAVDPADPNRVYVGTHDHGLFISFNGGSLWRKPDRVDQEPLEAIIASLDAQAPTGAGDRSPQPPAVFEKCNQCHGWMDATLNRRPTYWRVAPNRRDWSPTVARMARGAKLTPSEQDAIVAFLTAYTSTR